MNLEPRLDIYMSILGVLILIVHRATMLITFPNRFKLRYSIGILMLALVVTELYRRLTADLIAWNGLSPFFNLVLMCWLLKGTVFQKTFAYFFQYIFSVSILYLMEAIVGLFIDPLSENFSLVLFVPTMTIYAAYTFLMFKYGRHMFQKLLVNGRTSEWMLYSFGALFSFVVLTVSRDYPNSALLNILFILFIAWSFIVLCFAILTTHEKTKQRYDAEFARNIISTGRDHYQKMDEMYDKLRIIRHDHKYHLSAVREMLRTGDSDGANNYLTDIETELSEYELPSYCPNPVINALVSSYAERCSKAGIPLHVDISILKELKIPNYEACIIIGNLLENAVEANKKLTEGRMIEFAAQSTRTQLMFMVKNSFNGDVHAGEGELVSIKTNGGIGLQSVKAVATRHGGYLLTEWDSSTFTSYVTVRA